jgi:predicted dehydrogenase
MVQAIDVGPVRLALIGVGAVTAYHHLPAIRLDPRAELVAVCDTDEDLLERRRVEWNVPFASTKAEEVIRLQEVDAVVIATPNNTHCSLALEAARFGKHILCEKPLGLNASEVRQMLEAARNARVVHMTAFTYRFAPSMRYLRHLLKSGSLGTPRHFRSQRFLDWPETSWGWRQDRSKAGAGDLFDMTIHRIDFAIDLLGPLERVCGAVARFAPRDRTATGESCPPSDVDDWSCLIGEFVSGATGVWEGTTLAKGYHRNGFGHEWAEVNGSEGSAVYRLHEPNTILLGKHGGDLEPFPVPDLFLKPSGSPRDLSQGPPATVFRYDLMWEFISAIREGRDSVPSFQDGLNAQTVADAVLTSYARRSWVELPVPEVD